jgi:alginate O-acetyltransferase complex protein AlgJ
MAATKPMPLDREAIAKEEIGKTAISRRTALMLVLFFLFTMVSVPIIQRVLDHRAGEPGVFAIDGALPEAWKTFIDTSGGASRWDRLFAANAVLHGRMQTYETDLENDSFLAQAAIPHVQAFTAQYLGLGNEQTYIGRSGWLFYRPGVEYLTGEAFLNPARLHARLRSGSENASPLQPDPRVAILDFQRQLASRAITLVVVPTPVKAVVHPDRLSPAYDPAEAPVQNPSYRAFIDEMRAAGVRVFDPTDHLVRHVKEGRGDVFLKTDTHWRPEAMQEVADALAAFLRDEAALSVGDARFRTEVATVSNQGDVAVMLKLPEGQTVFPPEEVNLRVVLTPKGELWRPSRTADVLLLGDSFSNIYSLGAMNWGESAGFAEQLSFAMAHPLDTLRRNDSGAYASREMLAIALSRGKDLLAGKKIVIWQFAARELAVGDWRLLDLKLKEAHARAFYAPAGGAKPVRVTGTIEAVSPVPRPGSVPYKDHIFALQLSGLKGEGVPADTQAMVYLRSMADGTLTTAARLRDGDKVTLDIVSWNDVAERYERFNRSELDDEDLQLEPPCWGELLIKP